MICAPSQLQSAPQLRSLQAGAGYLKKDSPAASAGSLVAKVGEDIMRLTVACRGPKGMGS